MDSGKNAGRREKKSVTRRLIQVYAALLYNANLKGFIKGEIYAGPTKNVCVPGFNCYSCPGAVGACPLGALQNALASSGNRAPYYALGILALFGVTLGRTICGWLCPLGLIQELFYMVPTPKIKKSRYTRALTWLKYVILAIFVVGIPLAYSVQCFPVPGFCKYICPAGTSEGAMALLANPANADKFSMLGILFTRKFIIMTIIFTLCVFAYRAFCRFICPLGAIYGLFSKISFLGVKVEAAKCTDCGKCVSHCKMDIRKVGDHECIQCASCVDVCPAKAISFKCGRATLIENDMGDAQADKSGKLKSRRAKAAIAWAVALIVLMGALWYYNRPTDDAAQAPAPVKEAAQTTSGDTGAVDASDPLDPTDGKAEAAKTDGEAVGAVGGENEVPVGDEIPTGYEVGMRCPGFTVPLYGAAGGDFTLSTGKPAVINFWATWCTPCVGELPYFQQLYEAYGDKISLVAIHSNLVTDDVQLFLDGEGYSLPFALDESGDVIKSLGGSTMLPMTVIVDDAGIIVYNKTGSVTYPLLESLVAPLVG